MTLHFKGAGIDDESGAVVVNFDGGVEDTSAGGVVNEFPYAICDLVGWAVKRKDGTMVKYSMKEKVQSSTGQAMVKTYPKNTLNAGGQKSLSEWCNHNPAALPTFSSGRVNLYIADGFGVKEHKNEFDLVIDCGNVLELPYFYAKDTNPLTGDHVMVKALEEHIIVPEMVGPRILKIHWIDRAAPNLHPEFWIRLAETLGEQVSKTTDEFDVVINCQGGHGRSGTALVCLMMVMNPEYGAAEAIIHLRAIHCPRAIESREQHAYINSVASYLGQAASAADALAVSNYREAFKALKLESAKPYQERLK